MHRMRTRLISVTGVLLAGLLAIHAYGPALGDEACAGILLGTLALAVAVFRRLDPDWLPSRRDH
ncbi:hypothetical protein MWN34_11045 [Ancylobacter sp. 6x-1]|uniref:Uncharacterized protein n=1 Tax=Ancylobacter crimeensis TaxID=2579147 RepID=A0ABT0DBY9_9HYPH|nr:hypothetical protein [Ancylobacter crimeensis]MCK0197450.1 hypothetical protein [Ancylobacter crimeensis]